MDGANRNHREKRLKDKKIDEIIKNGTGKYIGFNSRIKSIKICNNNAENVCIRRIHLQI